MSDRIFGALMLLLALSYSWTARGFDPGFMSDPLGPSTFPYLLGAVLGITGLYLLVRPDPAAAWPPPKNLFQMLLIVILLVAYVAFLEWLGFIVATLITVSTLGWRLGASPKTAVLTGVGVAIGVYALFDLLLELPLPSGILGRLM